MRQNEKVIVKYSLIFLVIITGFLFFISRVVKSQTVEEEMETIKIALPYTTYIKDIDTNYYKKWLEEQIGSDIEFIYMKENNICEYLRLMFTSENSKIDAVFFPSYTNDMTDDIIFEYGKEGYILPLEKYMENPDSSIRKLFRESTEYNLEACMTSTDGHIYYMPAVINSRQSKNAQVLWINSNWLQALKLEIPKTTEEFATVLNAFIEKDPNGNGIRDEIPLIGCEAEASLQSYYFIMNAFIYTDPQNNFMYLENGKVKFAPITEQWKEALVFCSKLYEAGLLSNRSFTYSKNQFVQLVNDKQDVVGAFTSRNISEVVNMNSIEILYKYISVTPMEGPEGTQLAWKQAALPRIGAVITSKCKHPQAVFDLLDLMLSEEASLIGKYGEEGVDWEEGSIGDISQYGTKATIYIKNNLEGIVQNTTLTGIGPSAVPERFLDGTAWNGIQSDSNYIDIRAAISYEGYYPKEPFNIIRLRDAAMYHTGQEIKEYTQSMIERFIAGTVDIKDETAWQEYVEYYNKLELLDYINAVQMQRKKENCK